MQPEPQPAGFSFSEASPAETPSEELSDVFGAEAGDALAGPMDDVTEENTDENEYKTG